MASKTLQVKIRGENRFSAAYGAAIAEGELSVENGAYAELPGIGPELIRILPTILLTERP